MLNCFKCFFNIYFGTKCLKYQIRKTISSLHVWKCPNTLKLYALKPLLVKIGFVSFFSSSNMQKLYHLLGCHAIGMNSSLIFFLSALSFFKFTMPSQKSDNMLDKKAVLIRLKIKTICLKKSCSDYKEGLKKSFFK